MLLFLIMAAIAITVWGIILKLLQPAQGTQKMIASSSSLDEAVRSKTDSLTTEEFIYGVSNILPTSTLTEEEQLLLALKVQNDLAEHIDGSIDCEFVNWFGKPALTIKLKYQESYDAVVEHLNTFPDVTRVYLNMHSGEAVVQAAIYSEGDILESFKVPENLTHKDSAQVQALITEISTSFNLDPTAAVYDGDLLLIDVSSMTLSDVLDLFDFSFQHAMQASLVSKLAVVRGRSLVAYANLADTKSLYDSYYTSSELAPLFRLSFYTACDFLKGDLREYSKIYM